PHRRQFFPQIHHQRLALLYCGLSLSSLNPASVVQGIQMQVNNKSLILILQKWACSGQHLLLTP
ncbi:hypothetical protein, partial [Enterobacter cloacae complex sp. I5]|uniref:hypothetical protein n=1 Tax=Enterobacter cloacae complex sp. I5 TaxID=2779600 RepID=UPI001D022A00